MDGLVKRVIENFIIISGGLGLFVLCGFASEPLIAFSLFVLATGVVSVALFDAICMLNGISKRVSKEQSLIDNQKGLAWIWIVGLGLTLPMCALIYWCLDYPFDLIVGTVSGMYTFTGTMAMAWTTTQLILSYLLAFVAVFTVAWVIQTSKSPYGA